MEGAAPALLAQLAAATSLAGELDVADAGGDDAPPVLRVTPASRAAWSAIFRQHVMGARRGGDTDDMLFFVRVPANQIEPFFALRHDSKQVPPPEAADVNWEESCYLNLIMHNLEYTMEGAGRCISSTHTSSLTHNSQRSTAVLVGGREQVRVEGAGRKGEQEGVRGAEPRPHRRQV